MKIVVFSEIEERDKFMAMLKGKRFVFEEVCAQRGKFCVAPDGMLDYNMTWVESPRFFRTSILRSKMLSDYKKFLM